MVLILLEASSHLQVYWPAEGSVTAISVSAMNGLSTTLWLVWNVRLQSTKGLQWQSGSKRHT